MPHTLLLLGHSHINCITQALRAGSPAIPTWRSLQIKQWQGRVRRSDRSLTTAQINDMMETEIARIVGKLAGRPGRLPAKRLPGFVKSRDVSIVLCLRGAQHVIKGLVRPELPYDFIIPGEEHLPLESGTPVIPYGAIYARYEQILRSTTDQIGIFHRLIRHNLYHLEVPPPYGDNAYIEDKIGGYFTKAYPEGFEVASPILRYKLWRVSSNIYKRKCEELGIVFVPVPPAVLVDGKYLHPSGYYKDAVHGNEWYGEQIAQNLLSILKHQPVREV
jgi:hypothetical protein